MIQFLQTEFNGIYLFLKRNRSDIIVFGFAILFLSLNRYHPVWNDWFSSFLYFAALPVVVIVVLLRDNPLNFGLRLGNIRIWGVYTALTCIIAVPLLYAASHLASFQSYYRVELFSLFNHFLIYFVSLFGSEFLFRGFMLFGLKEKYKEGSIFIQMIPFVLVHLGKPELETLSTIITGIYFGYIVYRGNSFWPAFIIHLFINTFFVAVANF